MPEGCPSHVREKWAGLLPSGSTTVMVRNIPGRYKQKELMHEFEELGLQGTFDSFYLPGGRTGNLNAGYAFLNLVSHDFALEALEELDGYCFRKHQQEPPRLAGVSLARIQGREGNVRLRSKALARSSRAKKSQRAATEKTAAATDGSLRLTADMLAVAGKKVPKQYG